MADTPTGPAKVRAAAAPELPVDPVELKRQLDAPDVGTYQALTTFTHEVGDTVTEYGPGDAVNGADFSVRQIHALLCRSRIKPAAPEAVKV